MASLVNSSKHLKKWNQPFSDFSKKLKRREHFLTHSEASIVLISRARQRYFKKTTDQYPLWILIQNSQQKSSKSISQHIKRIIHDDQLEFIPGIQSCFNIWKPVNIPYLKNHMIISLMQKKPSTKFNDKISPFYDKNTQQIWNRRKLP